jgi:hypothetical protein
MPASDRPALTKKLAKLIAPPGFTGAAPGGPSRWNQGKENVWHPLKPELVVEVSYDHVTAIASATGPSCFAGDPTNHRSNVGWISSRKKNPISSASSNSIQFSKARQPLLQR